jgi:hypothetical protein
MKIGVSVSLDLKKLDLSRCPVVTKKDGTEARYLNMTTFINTDEQDQYENNGFIAQSQSKEEREAGEERPPILGNVKVFYTDGAAPAASKYTDPVVNSPITEDIPF